MPRHYLFCVTDAEWAARALEASATVADGTSPAAASSLASTDFVRLALKYARVADDEGGASGRRVPFGTFSLLVMAAGQGRDLADALRRMVDAMRLLRPDLVARLRRGRRALSFSLASGTASGVDVEIRTEFLMLAVHCALRWLTAASLRPSGVRAAREHDDHAASLLSVLGCAIRRSATGVTIHYDLADAKRPLRLRRYESWATQELPEFYKLLAEAMSPRSCAAAPNDPQKFVSHVDRLIAGGLKGESRIAAELGISPASLRRRMAEAGASYRQRVEAARREIVDRLLQTELRLDDIAIRAGYSDVRALRRACVKWFGIPPGEYRKVLR
ncbi:helix-turn-helix domain-containing protein [Sphingopyxis sp. LARHCG72]